MHMMNHPGVWNIWLTFEQRSGLFYSGRTSPLPVKLQNPTLEGQKSRTLVHPFQGLTQDPGSCATLGFATDQTHRFSRVRYIQL